MGETGQSVSSFFAPGGRKKKSLFFNAERRKAVRSEEREKSTSGCPFGLSSSTAYKKKKKKRLHQLTKGKSLLTSARKSAGWGGFFDLEKGRRAGPGRSVLRKEELAPS